MSAEQKIKVSKSKLIETIRTRKAEALEHHNEATRAHSAAYDTWKQNAITLLERALADVKTDKPLQGNYVMVSSAPARPVLNTMYDRHIALLEMASEETISITASDFSIYVA